jgi:hypothetical protein
VLADPPPAGFLGPSIRALGRSHAGPALHCTRIWAIRCSGESFHFAGDAALARGEPERAVKTRFPLFARLCFPGLTEATSARAAKLALREDELFAIEAVAREYCASWKPGENPPDAYLAIGDDVPGGHREARQDASPDPAAIKRPCLAVGLDGLILLHRCCEEAATISTGPKVRDRMRDPRRTQGRRGTYSAAERSR